MVDPYGGSHFVHRRQLNTTCKQVFMHASHTRFGVVVGDYRCGSALIFLTCGPLTDTNIYQHGCAGDVGDCACVDSFLDAF